MGAVSTETYQAQYRVLEAFSLFNAILSSSSSKFDSSPMQTDFNHSLGIPVATVWSCAQTPQEWSQGYLVFTCHYF
jgi:hypothetical protein